MLPFKRLQLRLRVPSAPAHHGVPAASAATGAPAGPEVRRGVILILRSPERQTDSIIGLTAAALQQGDSTRLQRRRSRCQCGAAAGRARDSAGSRRQLKENAAFLARGAASRRSGVRLSRAQIAPSSGREALSLSAHTTFCWAQGAGVQQSVHAHPAATGARVRQQGQVLRRRQLVRARRGAIDQSTR